MAERKVIGAGWIKQTDKGEYVALSFKADEIRGLDLSNCWVSLSVNNRKSKPTQPDYTISASPKQNQNQPEQRPQQQRSAFPRPQNNFTQSNKKEWDGPEF